MSSKRKDRGETSVRHIEKAARMLSMNTEQFFAYAIHKENEKLSQKGSMRNMICSGNPIEINSQAKYDALRFGFLKDGSLDSSFVISDYYTKCATGVVKLRKMRRSSSSHRERSVRANFVRG